MTDAEQRIVGLERAAADHESQLQDLSDMVAEQWRTIERLEAEMKRLHDRLSKLEDEAAGAGGKETPPPHY